MFWSFGEFEFNANTRVLSRPSGETILEPKVASLLYYLCQHPQRNISRDELFAEVWHGQLVTENAITRVIALLRKALSDENKVKKFIVTVPKIGYRFIVTPINLTNQQQAELLVEPPVITAKTNDGEILAVDVKKYKYQQPNFFNNRLFQFLIILLSISLFTYFFIANQAPQKTIIHEYHL
ncbi:MAG: DNA-binding winged helix-turn-helix (wHTH) protein [Alteromonadaceae bacterium]|jgi:DNA-binding winged helix-turn-helix (wHTH) protein